MSGRTGAVRTTGKTIVLASRNPVKARAVRDAFGRLFPGVELRLETVTAASGVDDQPRSDEETLAGAENRAADAARRRPDADLWIGIEGGVAERDGEMAAFAWIVARSADAVGRSRSATFALPEPVARLVRRGHELGDADDLVFQRSGSKHRDGAVGILTGNVIDRAALYEHAAVLALARFKNPELYDA